jgi:formate/nitrite transporter FocA (FNT family)
MPKATAEDHGDGDDKAPHEMPASVSEREVEDVEDRARLRAPVVYEIVRREGETEMQRPAVSLWWSGVAAGLSISFSLLAQGILRQHLPEAEWRPLIVAMGYPVGFLMVVLGRQQLFTENTVTVVLPVAVQFTAENLCALARMWGIVFAANLAGTLFAALFCNFTPVLEPALLDAMLEISKEAMQPAWFEMVLRAISAGFIIATMVWLLPSAEGAQFHVIAFATYLIGIGHFAHIVAGSVESFLLVVHGDIGLGHMLVHFTVPVLIGNIIGGTALFAVLSYAQVMKEM